MIDFIIENVKAVIKIILYEKDSGPSNILRFIVNQVRNIKPINEKPNMKRLQRYFSIANQVV